jgi:hypothetical protein
MGEPCTKGAQAEGSVGSASAVETETPTTPKLNDANPINANVSGEEKV